MELGLDNFSILCRLELVGAVVRGEIGIDAGAAFDNLRGTVAAEFRRVGCL